MSEKPTRVLSVPEVLGLITSGEYQLVRRNSDKTITDNGLGNYLGKLPPVSVNPPQQRSQTPETIITPPTTPPSTLKPLVPAPATAGGDVNRTQTIGFTTSASSSQTSVNPTQSPALNAVSKSLPNSLHVTTAGTKSVPAPIMFRHLTSVTVPNNVYIQPKLNSQVIVLTPPAPCLPPQNALPRNLILVPVTGMPNTSNNIISFQPPNLQHSVNSLGKQISIATNQTRTTLSPQPPRMPVKSIGGQVNKTQYVANWLNGKWNKGGIAPNTTVVNVLQCRPPSKVGQDTLVGAPGQPPKPLTGNNVVISPQGNSKAPHKLTIISRDIVSATAARPLVTIAKSSKQSIKCTDSVVPTPTAVVPASRTFTQTTDTISRNSKAMMLSSAIAFCANEKSNSVKNTESTPDVCSEVANIHNVNAYSEKDVVNDNKKSQKINNDTQCAAEPASSDRSSILHNECTTVSNSTKIQNSEPHIKDTRSVYETIVERDGKKEKIISIIDQTFCGEETVEDYPAKPEEIIPTSYELLGEVDGIRSTPLVSFEFHRCVDNRSVTITSVGDVSAQEGYDKIANWQRHVPARLRLKESGHSSRTVPTEVVHRIDQLGPKWTVKYHKRPRSWDCGPEAAKRRCEDDRLREEFGLKQLTIPTEDVRPLLKGKSRIRLHRKKWKKYLHRNGYGRIAKNLRKRDPDVPRVRIIFPKPRAELITERLSDDLKNATTRIAQAKENINYLDECVSADKISELKAQLRQQEGILERIRLTQNENNQRT